MRCLKRNKQRFWYCNPNDAVVCLDENGNETGERITTYDDPEEISANISPATGVYRTEEFGAVENYDKVILLEGTNWPIREDSVFFIDKEPTKTTANTYRWFFVNIHVGQRLAEVIVDIPVPDYIVWRISKSLNHTAVAVKKAKTVGYDGEEEPYFPQDRSR